MKINEAGISLIKKWEGNHGPKEDGLLHSYICPAGVWTISWGATYIEGAPVRANTTITPEQGEDLLLADVGQAETAIGKLITAELTPNMFSALCSWTYNLGTGALQRSSLRRLYLNDGRYEEAADEFLRWVFCNGRRLRGLVLRRTDERALFLALSGVPTAKSR